MTDANKQPPAPEKKAMTAAEAAKQVRRPRVSYVGDGTDKDGNAVKKAVTKLVAVSASEVLSFKDYGTHVVVVTNDGQKFSSADTATGATE